jgi:hypothetical protein
MKNCVSKLLRSRRKIAFLDHLLDVLQMTVSVLGGVVNGELQGAKSIFLNLTSRKPHVLEAHRVDRKLDLLEACPCIEEGAESHVPAYTAEAVKVGNFHKKSKDFGVVKSRRISIIITPWSGDSQIVEDPASLDQ